MPRRELLTAAQRKALLALPEEQENLLQYYTLSVRNLDAVKHRILTCIISVSLSSPQIRPKGNSYKRGNTRHILPSWNDTAPKKAIADAERKREPRGAFSERRRFHREKIGCG
jgi:hypothetical protein